MHDRWAPPRWSSGELRRRAQWWRGRLSDSVGVERWSWPALNSLDRYLVRSLPARPGFFVEAGAYDGYAQSNTFYLERHRQWRGLLIEAVPHLARDCRRLRTRSEVVEAALVPPELAGKVIEVEYADLMSLIPGSKGGGREEADHITLGRRLRHARPGRVRVPGLTISQILTQHAVSHIDLLSLDVEGLEGPVLRGLDFDRHAPEWLLVEANDPAAVNDVVRSRYCIVGEPTAKDVLYRRR